jgi:hypothetical protein
MQLQQRGEQTMESILRRRQAALQYYRDEYDGAHRTDSAHPSADRQGLDVVPNEEAYDEVDCCRSINEPDLTSNTRLNIMTPDVTNVTPK